MKGMMESLPVFAAFLAGLLLGVAGLVPAWLLASGLPMLLLSALVFLAGMGLGAGDDLPQLLRGFDLRLLLLPLCTIVGSLLFLPLFARWGGRLAPISVAGINSMDVCLPMIVRCAGDRQVVPQALLHGIVLEVSVPVLIAAFC